MNQSFPKPVRSSHLTVYCAIGAMRRLLPLCVDWHRIRPKEAVSDRDSRSSYVTQEIAVFTSFLSPEAIEQVPSASFAAEA